MIQRSRANNFRPRLDCKELVIKETEVTMGSRKDAENRGILLFSLGQSTFLHLSSLLPHFLPILEQPARGYVRFVARSCYTGDFACIYIFFPRVLWRNWMVSRGIKESSEKQYGRQNPAIAPGRGIIDLITERSASRRYNPFIELGNGDFI